MNTLILSRGKAIRYCYKKHDNESIMISISDPYDDNAKPFKTENNKIIAILRLEFQDVVTGCYKMTESQAKQICDFVQRFYKEDTDIIVHCHMGVSRSAAVAAALHEWFGESSDNITRSWRYRPNKHVLSLMRAEITKRGKFE